MYTEMMQDIWSSSIPQEQATVLKKALGAPVGRAFGMTCAGPAAIGTVLADVAVKAANVEVVGYTSPGAGSHSNEVILTFTGDSGAVRQAVKAAIEAGKKMLGALGDERSHPQHRTSKNRMLGQKSFCRQTYAEFQAF